ncbi:MAG: hypothetical protein HXX20_09585 [Chloroflexi bacterium]|nr:hypothetical protein [Chloroflexota bacterium]
MSDSKVKNKDNIKLTEGKKNILKLLIEYQALTTSQIWRELNTEKTLRTIQRYLIELKSLTMVRAFEIPLHKKGAKEDGWLLLKKGADAIETTYDSSYSRIPSPTKMKNIAQELELKKQIVQQAGWKLMQPFNFNSTHPKPEQTEQYKIILDTYSKALFKELQERQKNSPNSPTLGSDIESYNKGLYKSLIPKDANEWVAYLEIYNDQNQLVKRLLVIFILSTDETAEKFWQHRVEKYQKVAEKIFVFGVFPTSEEANTHKELLKEGSLRTISLEKISTGLNSIKVQSGAK